MKNFKRTLALVLAVIMVVGTFASVSAANVAWYADGVKVIESLGIATIGSTAEDKITRDEFVLWVAKIESGLVADSYWTSAMATPFTDVTEEHNQAAIAYSYSRDFIVGNGDGTFAPDKNITLGEASAVIVRLMRYQSKVEGAAEFWAINNMDVANEYAKAFNNTFINKVGLYDPNHELSKGQAAYILATIMNFIEGQKTVKYEGTSYERTTYKSLTIDGMNIGERFIDILAAGGVGTSVYGNSYYVSKLAIDEITGEFDKSETVELTSVNTGDVEELSGSDFLKLLRVANGLSATKAADEAEIVVRDYVKLGNLVNVVLDDGDIDSISVVTNSLVVDTHVLQEYSGGAEVAGETAVAGWNANSVTASSKITYTPSLNASFDTANAFTWSSDGKKLTILGNTYDVNGGKLKVYAPGDDGALEAVAAADARAMIPTLAEGEVTLVFSDDNGDGKYERVVIAEKATPFVTEFLENITIKKSSYIPGYFVHEETASGALQLLVLSSGRQFDGGDAAYPVAHDHDYGVSCEDADCTYGSVNKAAPYQVLELAAIKSGVIERSNLYTYGGETYFVVEVLSATGEYEKVYLPTTIPAAATKSFTYSISGVEGKKTVAWDYEEKLSFISEDLEDILGFDPKNEDATKYAKEASKLVGQYINYITGSDKVAYYCKSASTAINAKAGYLLGVEKVEGDNAYNVTVANVKGANAQTVVDVATYTVNASASAMFDTANYAEYANIFTNGSVYESTSIFTPNVEGTLFTAGNLGRLSPMYLVNLNSNGSFNYITVVEKTSNKQGIEFKGWTGTLNLNAPVVVDDDEITYSTALVEYDADKYGVEVVAGVAAPTATVTVTAEIYSDPRYMLTKNDKGNYEWTLTVTATEITNDYDFKVDQAVVTKKNVADSELAEILLNDIDDVKLAKWIVFDVKNEVPVANYDAHEVAGHTCDKTTCGDWVDEIKDNRSNYVLAQLTADANGNLVAKYDYRGIDYTSTISYNKITVFEGKSYYTFNDAKVAEADYLADIKAGEFTEGTVTAGVVATAESAVANVAFTAMASTEKGYLPGSYWFTTANETKIGMTEGIVASDKDDTAADTAVKYRLTKDTEVVLLTPTTAGYVVSKMTPAEAAARDLIVTHYNFVVFEQPTDWEYAEDVEFYNNKLGALVLIGQDALVATDKEVVDDGLTVGADEYLVYVPSDAETVLTYTAGSNVIVSSNKSVYAVPSGTEIGSIYYEYTVIGSTKPTINTKIASGWYIVEKDGKIVDSIGIETATDSTGKNGVYMKNVVITVEDGEIIGTYSMLNKNGKKTGETVVYDLEDATLLYQDANGTLKVVDNKTATFASDAIFELSMKAAKEAVKAAELNYNLYKNTSVKAKYQAALNEAKTAYNEALAANIDKYFNGDIWTSFKNTVAKEQAIQGEGIYTVNVYEVDGQVFVILNDWAIGTESGALATVTSVIK